MLDMCLCECGAERIAEQARMNRSVLFLAEQNFITDFLMDSETYIEII
jgi:hypothetical protein